MTKVVLRETLRPEDPLKYCTYDAVVENVHVAAGLSRPDDNKLHRSWLGSNNTHVEELDGDTYSIGLLMGPLTLNRLERNAGGSPLQVAKVNSLRIDVLVSQWPSPWVQLSPFMSGDPNAQLCVVDIAIGTIQIREQLQFIRALSERMASNPSNTKVSDTKGPAILSAVPRIHLGLQTSSISACLISADDTPFALEAMTDGLMASFTSRYHTIPNKSLDRDHSSLRMDFTFLSMLSPLFVSVCSGPLPSVEPTTPRSIDPDPAWSDVLSMEAIQLSGNGTALGDLVDGPYSSITIDVSSIFSEVHCATEVVSVELWQPDVIRTLSHIMAMGSGKQKAPEKTYLLDTLPFGLWLSLSVGRAMVFTTSPELAPDDMLGIFRGIASHTGLSVSFCAIRPSHAERIRGVLGRAQRRLQLLLPAEQIAKAVSSTTVPSAPAQAFFRIVLWDLAVRDAVSTAFSADDPWGTGDMDEHLRSREWLHMGAAEAEIVLSAQRTKDHLSRDSCVIRATIGSIRASIHLAQVYNLLLASRTLKSLVPPKKRLDDSPTQSAPTLAIDCHLTLQKIQVLWTFPIRSKLFIRVAGLHCSFSSGNDIIVQLDNISLAVNVQVRRGIAMKEQWEELASLTQWRLNVRRRLNPTRLSVSADCGRLQIPFDYVLADLILDVNATLKSVRHLVPMVASGQFRQPSSPMPEGPKHVPYIDFHFRCLTLEAMDEDLEANLGLIWRAGSDAARVRLERESAFQAKVTTIRSQKYPFDTTSGDPTSDYQFSSNHTVTIEEARQRLDHVHSVAWKSAFAIAMSQREHQRMTFTQNFGATWKKTNSPERDMVSVNKPRLCPPMCSLIFENLALSLSPPLFPLDHIPDFLYAEDSGLPRDAEFTLLVPIHIRLASSSLKLSFRDYPVPLLNVPPSSTKAATVFMFECDLVIAEEVGTDKSVQWVDCAIVAPHSGVHGASPLSIRIPKTIMPVKFYARPNIKVSTDGVTDFAWGVSYSPATQDFMRILDTFSHAPKDSSPPVGFWDKVRNIEQLTSYI